MDIAQLEQFLVLARVQHMTRAAEELNIAQPSLSKTIKRLETELGVALFDRPGRRIRLNRFGAAYLTSVEQVFFALDEGRRQVREMAALDQGEITLAAEALHWLPDLLTDFKAKQTVARFRLFQRTLPEIQHQLERGEIDFGFSAGPLGEGSRWQHLLTEEVYLIVPRGHRLAGRDRVPFQEVAPNGVVTCRAGALRDTVDAACREAGFAPQIVCEADEAGTIHDFVQAGLGVAFLPAMMRQHWGNKDLEWIRLTDPVCHLTLGVVWNEAHHLSAAASAFREFIIKYFAADEWKTPPNLPA